MKEIPTGDATPEQLLQIIDTELAARRSQSPQQGRNRAIILVVGLLFIVIAAGAALLVLDQMLVDLRSDGRSATSPPGETAKTFEN